MVENNLQVLCKAIGRDNLAKVGTFLVEELGDNVNKMITSENTEEAMQYRKTCQYIKKVIADISCLVKS